MAAALPALCLAVKPFPALALAAWVALRCPRLLGRLTAAGLVLSAVGDVLLEAGFFLPGLLAFLSAHVAYVAAFLSAERRPALGRAVPFLAWGVRRLRPPAPRARDDGAPRRRLRRGDLHHDVAGRRPRRQPGHAGPGRGARPRRRRRLRRERHAHRLRPLRRADSRGPLADHGPLLARPVGHRGVGRARLRYAARTGERHDDDDRFLSRPRLPRRGHPLALPRPRAPSPRDPRRLLRRPGRHAGAAGGRRRDGGLPAAPQREHALGLPDERRDGRSARRRARRARRLPGRAGPPRSPSAPT